MEAASKKTILRIELFHVVMLLALLVNTATLMTRQEIEQKMDELAREYRETHDPEIPEEIFELGGFGEMEHLGREAGRLNQGGQKSPCLIHQK
jgi:hypothetical protein